MFGLKGADGKHNSSYSVTQLKGLQTNLFGMSNNELDIHMSDLDEETKRILAEVDSDDSKDSNENKPPTEEYTKKKNKSDSFHEYDIHEQDDVDDREW